MKKFSTSFAKWSLTCSCHCYFLRIYYVQYKDRTYTIRFYYSLARKFLLHNENRQKLVSEVLNCTTNSIPFYQEGIWYSTTATFLREQ